MTNKRTTKKPVKNTDWFVASVWGRSYLANKDYYVGGASDVTVGLTEAQALTKARAGARAAIDHENQHYVVGKLVHLVSRVPPEEAPVVEEAFPLKN